jgi:hypothetical protein
VNGKVVDARYKDLMTEALEDAKQFFAASTAIVITSSSQLHIARSPFAKEFRLASNQAFASAIAFLLSLARGI